MENFKNLPLVKKLGFNRIVLVGVLILLYFVFSLGSGRMLGQGDINNALNMVDYLGFLALGVTFVIATGGIDFSIGPVMVCAGLIGGRLLVTFGWPLWLALIMCVVVGFIFGCFNGMLVAYMGLPSFISSMASMMLAKGVGSVFTHVQNSNWPASGEPNSWYKYFVTYNGIPTGLIFLLVVAIICGIIMNKTKIGRYILCIGSNREAVRLSGGATSSASAPTARPCGSPAWTPASGRRWPMCSAAPWRASQPLPTWASSPRYNPVWATSSTTTPSRAA